MPSAESRASKSIPYESREDNVRAVLMRDAWDMKTDPGLVCAIDPTLKITDKVATEICKYTPKLEIYDRAMFRYYSVVLKRNVSSSSADKPVEIPKARTKHTGEDIVVLNRFLAFFENSVGKLPEDAAAQMTGYVVSLLGMHFLGRPDMTSDSSFPMQPAIDYAIECPPDMANPATFFTRLVILEHAPSKKVIKTLATHARKGRDILSTLMAEEAMIENIRRLGAKFNNLMPEGAKIEDTGESVLFTPDFLQFLQLVPVERNTVRSIIYMIAGEEFRDLKKVVDHLDDPKKYYHSDVFRHMENIMYGGWLHLFDEEKAELLRQTAEVRVKIQPKAMVTEWASILDVLKNLYPEYDNDPYITPVNLNVLSTLPRMNMFIQDLIGNKLYGTQESITESLKLRVQKDPEYKLGAIAKWFPEVAAEVEKARPISLRKRLAAIISPPVESECDDGQ